MRNVGRRGVGGLRGQATIHRRGKRWWLSVADGVLVGAGEPTTTPYWLSANMRQGEFLEHTQAVEEAGFRAISGATRG